ncbi:hypothetical protein [Bariatricus massiliensis]|uniref:hypothetical protein n=1 Tax=Bariatricus massiliensis TaxID=1745713 RepID=UPI0012B5A42C|nr:hypothetical protein [Bariatricus massiliensis]
MARRRKPRSGKDGVCWHTNRLIEADIGRSPTTEKRRLRGAWHGEESRGQEKLVCAGTQTVLSKLT